MLIGQSNLILKTPFSRHVHDGISKLAKICTMLYCSGNIYLVLYYPNSLKLFAIAGFIGCVTPQFFDILAPHQEDTTVDTSQPKSI